MLKGSWREALSPGKGHKGARSWETGTNERGEREWKS